MGQQPRAGLATEGYAYAGLGTCQASGAPCPRLKQFRQPLSKGTACAGRVDAVEAPDLQVHADRTAQRGQIRRTTQVAAVQLRTDLAASGAASAALAAIGAKMHHGGAFAMDRADGAAGQEVVRVHPLFYSFLLDAACICRRPQVVPRKVRKNRNQGNFIFI